MRRSESGSRVSHSVIWLLQVGIGLAVLNVLLWITLPFVDRFIIQNRGNPVKKKYDVDLTKLYPGFERAELDALLMETWNRPYVYEPFTQFKERPFTGRYVNVHQEGFRFTSNQGPWPPDREKYFTAFVFGGSTTFGYGVPDGQTVTSYLQESLNGVRNDRPVRVYNFGRGYYYSSQERILFERLVLKGLLPDLAIFVDGANEFFFEEDRPAFSDRVNEVFALPKRTADCGSTMAVLARLPVVVAINRIWRAAVSESDQSDVGTEPENHDEGMIEGMISRYLRNKDLIEHVANAEGIGTVFVWQPVPTYKYNLSLHPFAAAGFGKHAYSKAGYPAMARTSKERMLGRRFIWCADIQTGVTEPLYVDIMHYSGRANAMLAKCITDSMMEIGIVPGKLPERGPFSDATFSNSAGGPRL